MLSLMKSWFAAVPLDGANTREPVGAAPTGSRQEAAGKLRARYLPPLVTSHSSGAQQSLLMASPERRCCDFGEAPPCDDGAPPLC